MFRSPSCAAAPPDQTGIFGRGWAYRLGQRALYRARAQETYVSQYVRAMPGDRVLDVGCGPGIFRDLLPASVRYCGIDPNPAYIESARARFGAAAEFHCGYLNGESGFEAGGFDIVMINGVLHHVPDEEATRLLTTCAALLRNGGRMVSRDGCFHPDQTLAERFFLHRDRGDHIRPREGYVRLISPHFRLLRAEIRRDLLRVPYPLFIAEGEKPA